jgi:hypothetical protein
MDKKACLDLFSSSFSSLFEGKPHVRAGFRPEKRLLLQDPMEHRVLETLLFEAVETILRQRPPSPSSPLVFMDRGGLGDGARSAAGLCALFASHVENSSKSPPLLHVAFNTPAGLALLTRSAVTKAAADHDLLAGVSVFEHSVESADTLALQTLDARLCEASPVISFAGSGSAGLIAKENLFGPDPMLARSHRVVMSFPDPEGLLGEIRRYSSLIGHDADLASIRFRVQIRQGGGTADLGEVMLSASSLKETTSDLAMLIEAARRHRWLAVLEPVRHRETKSTPGLVCPCRSLLTDPDFLPSVKAIKTVPVGACTTLVAIGVHSGGIEL